MNILTFEFKYRGIFGTRYLRVLSN